MHTCKKCGESKPKVDMSFWGGKVSKICKDCRGNGGGRHLEKKGARW